MTRHVTEISWVESPHLDEADREALSASYLPHERDARTMGKISLGAGAIYPVAESEIICEPFQIPVYWRHLYGLDVGWNRTAACWFAYDAETDIAYIYSEHYQGMQQPAVHAEAIKARGVWIPGIIDSAARGRSQSDGSQLMLQYQALGLNLAAVEKTWKGGRPPVEASIYEVWTRLSTGRLKVFSTCQNWLMEFRLYRRNEKGQVDPKNTNDHLMDATRYVCSMGFGMAAMQPRSNWDRMMPGQPRSRHQFEFEPMAEAWAVDNPRPQSPWARR